MIEILNNKTFGNKPIPWIPVQNTAGMTTFPILVTPAKAGVQKIKD
jgi:hypothetical protein